MYGTLLTHAWPHPEGMHTLRRSHIHPHGSTQLGWLSTRYVHSQVWLEVQEGPGTMGPGTELLADDYCVSGWCGSQQ